MKVGKTPEQQQAAAVLAAKARTASTASTAAATSATTTTDDPSAKVALSTTATSLTGKDANSTADFNADKVTAVSHSIDNGTYKVNPDVIADKLLSNAKELLTQTSQ